MELPRNALDGPSLPKAFQLYLFTYRPYVGSQHRISPYTTSRSINTIQRFDSRHRLRQWRNACRSSKTWPV